MGWQDTVLKEYKIYIKYIIIVAVSYAIRCVVEFIYNKTQKKTPTAAAPVESKGEGKSSSEMDSPLFEDDGKTVVEDAERNFYYDKYLPAKSEEKIPYSLPRYSPEEAEKRARDFYQLVNSRRSCRFFSSDPVPRAVLEHCILAAGTSPSGAHTEPWKFVVVYNKEDRIAIREMVEDEEKINYERRMGKNWLQDLAKIKTTYVKEYISEADCIILVFKEPFHIKDGVKHNNWYYEASVSISVGILLCALNNVGLATVTSTPMNCGPAIRRYLGRSEHEKLAFLLPVGYPAKDATVPDLHRGSIDKICTFV